MAHVTGGIHPRIAECYTSLDVVPDNQIQRHYHAGACGKSPKETGLRLDTTPNNVEYQRGRGGA